MDIRDYLPLAVFGLLVILSFLIIKPLLIAIFIGALLAFFFTPLHKKLKNKISNKTISALIICFFAIIIFAIPIIYFAKTLIAESYILFISVKQKTAIGLFSNCGNQICQMIKEFSNNPQINGHIQSTIKTLAEWIIQKSSNLLVSLPKFFLNIFIVFFTMFYFLKDSESLLKKTRKLFSKHKKKYDLILDRLKEITHGIVFGYFFVAIIQGTLGALGFFLFGIHSPIFWGLVMAFLALIPYLGTGIIWIPASLILILDGIFQNSNSTLFRGIGLLIYSFVFVASLDNFLKPIMIGDKAKVHPAIVMLGIFGGLFMFGPLGVFIGPLVLSLTIVLIDAYFSIKN